MELPKHFETLFNTKIHEGYGLTEGPVSIGNPCGRAVAPGSIGRPIPESNGKIVHENGKDVKQDEKGELIFKGPAVMKGCVDGASDAKETINDG